VGVQESDLVNAEAVLGVALPADYRWLLVSSDGLIEIFPNAYLDLWPLDRVVGVSVGDLYEMAERLPSHLLIGSDGGGELLALDMRSAPPSVVLVNANSGSLAEVAYQAPSVSELISGFHAGGSYAFG
jgi:hypothetical protein